MKKILIDGIHITENMKGVGHYVANTLRRLSALGRGMLFHVTVLDNVGQGVLPQNDNIRYLPIPWKNHLWHGFVTLPKTVRRIRPDAVWIPYETPVAPLKSPFMMLCHDIPKAILQAQQGTGRLKISRQWLIRGLDDILLKRTLHRSRRVFSNSYYVGDWLVRKMGVSPAVVRQAPCAPAVDFNAMSRHVDIDQVRRYLNAENGYIFTIYTGDLRENFFLVPRVYDSLVRNGFDHKLVVAGVRKDVRPFVEQAVAQYSWKDNVRIHPFIGFDEIFNLARLYTAADVYLDLTRQEGFGMQVVEAMACGTPVICSDRGALPEIVSGAAILVDLDHTDRIVAAATAILTDTKLRQEMVDRGYKRADFFSWDKTAGAIYQGILDIL